MADDIWVKKEYLLFDLDGTLTDPKLGITTCVQYALKDAGIEEPDLDKLECFIGPPLKDSFMQFYGFTEEQAEKGVAKYRERFAETGLYENEIYRGVPQMLKKLKNRGLHLAVASSKPTVFVEKILEYFKIREYFDVVVGSELDGTRAKKSEVVNEALRQLFGKKPVEKNKVYMIGDRKFDVEGAKAFGIESVGVSYGYGGIPELMEAHADYIVRSVEELRRFLLRGYEDMEKNLNSLQKIWVLIFHFALFMVVRVLVQSTCLALCTGFEVEMTANVQLMLYAAGYFAGGLAITRGAYRCVTKTVRDMYLTHLTWDPKSSYGLLALSGAGLSLGVTMLLNLTGMTGASQSFQEVSAGQMSGAAPLAFLVFGVITPVAEELLFRGVIYGYLRKFADIRTAIVASALLFGVYHGNMVQAVYAALMGYLIAWAYEYFGTFTVPVVLHVGMNILALVISYTGLVNTAFFSWPVCLLLLLLGGAGTLLLAKRKRVL